MCMGGGGGVECACRSDLDAAHHLSLKLMELCTYFWIFFVVSQVSRSGPADNFVTFKLTQSINPSNIQSINQSFIN